jgi:ATP-dependent DNA helicase RecG
VEQDDFVALANAKGGTILVGVEEGRKSGRQFGKVVGCNVGEENRRKLVNKASSCLPAVNVKITAEGSVPHKVLRVDVVEATQKTCCTQSGTYKIRKDGTKVAIDPELMAVMILERESKEFLARFKAAGDAIITELNR